MQRKRRMVQCATLVNKEAVSRISIGGVEHVVVSSFTLPDDVVMNGGLYPATEIANSFASLERSLAPIEHPTDSAGNYISASDPEAIHNFDAGAFNANVTREGGRVHIEKRINVQVAMKTDRGKRLMDRINELETSDSPRPIHTSVGVFLEVEELAKPKTNKAGAEYNWIARNMFFDHDAILLDNVGAAQPSQGVGMAVNRDGEEIETERVVLEHPAEPENITDRPAPNDLRTNADGDSFAGIMDALQKAINGIVTADWIWLADVFDDIAIFETPQGFFQVPWTISESGDVTLSGIPVRVDRVVTYEPKINSQRGEDEMKELILNALAKAGIETDGLSEDELFAKYNELQATPPEAVDQTEAIGLAVSAAIKPLQDQITGFETQLTANATEERAKLITCITESGKYEGLTEEGLKLLPVDELKTMAANCGLSFGIDLNVNNGSADDGFEAPTDMPE